MILVLWHSSPSLKELIRRVKQVNKKPIPQSIQKKSNKVAQQLYQKNDFGNKNI